jgi:oligopeptide transport system ATP-binding protein
MGGVDHLLEVKDLHVRFDTPRGQIHAVNGVDFHLDRGEVLALVGESGSGKTVTGHAVVGILKSPPAVIDRGEIRYAGENLLAMDPEARRELRGTKIAIIFQDALAALNPVLTVGLQLERLLRYRTTLGRAASKERAIQLLQEVGIPSAASRFGAYPHEFSGGMRQRVMVAMAIALEPDVLIADEPTTALDVTIQAQILALIREVQRRTNMGVLLVTHDLAVVAEAADRVAVLYAGRIAERIRADELFRHAHHPYTEALLRSAPAAATRGRRLRVIAGAPPDPRRIPAGCPFHPRCDYAVDRCREEVPLLRAVHGEGVSACHLAEAVGRRAQF